MPSLHLKNSMQLLGNLFLRSNVHINHQNGERKYISDIIVGVRLAGLNIPLTADLRIVHV